MKRKVLISFTLVLFCIVFVELLLELTDIGTIIISVVCSLISCAIVEIISNVFNNGLIIKKYKFNFKPSFYNEDIRISFAYLIRIKIDGKYLLIKSSRFKRFQPIGGVYHQFDKEKMEKLGFKIDENQYDKNDIRGTIKGRNLRSFIKWFDNCKSKRERGAAREFYEEMVGKNIINPKKFLSLDFTFSERKYKGIAYSQFTNKNELLLFDIFELELNDAQKKVIKKALINNNQIMLAEEADIKTLGVGVNSSEQKYSTHTPYIIENYEIK